MKRVYKFVCLFLLMFIADGVTAEREILLDGLMAKVNGHSITIGDVMQQIQPLQRQLIAKYKGEELRRETRRMFNKALENLIADKLIVDAYNEQKGQIPEWVVDNRLNEILHDVFNDDRAAMMRALADDNLTYEKWRSNVRDQIIVSSMRQANIQQRIKISAVDVQKYYMSHIDKYKSPSMVRLEVILLKQSGDNEGKDVMKQAKEILGRLKIGEDFYKIAKEFSQGYNAEKGGDWGWIEPTDLCKELQDSIATLKDGEVSDVIEVGNDLYILKVFARKGGSVESFSEARADIEEKLRNKEGARIHKEWIASLKKNAQVEIMDIDPFADN